MPNSLKRRDFGLPSELKDVDELPASEGAVIVVGRDLEVLDPVLRFVDDGLELALHLESLGIDQEDFAIGISHYNALSVCRPINSPEHLPKLAHRHHLMLLRVP